MEQEASAWSNTWGQTALERIAAEGASSPCPSGAGGRASTLVGQLAGACAGSCSAVANGSQEDQLHHQEEEEALRKNPVRRTPSGNRLIQPRFEAADVVVVAVDWMLGVDRW